MKQFQSNLLKYSEFFKKNKYFERFPVLPKLSLCFNKLRYVNVQKLNFWMSKEYRNIKFVPLSVDIPRKNFQGNKCIRDMRGKTVI